MIRINAGDLDKPPIAVAVQKGPPFSTRKHRGEILIIDSRRLATVPVRIGKRFSTHPNVIAGLKFIVQSDPQVSVAGEIIGQPGILNPVRNRCKTPPNGKGLLLGCIPCATPSRHRIGFSIVEADIPVESVKAGVQLLAEVDREPIRKRSVCDPGIGKSDGCDRRRLEIKHINSQKVLCEDTPHDRITGIVSSCPNHPIKHSILSVGCLIQ